MGNTTQQISTICISIEVVLSKCMLIDIELLFCAMRQRSEVVEGPAGYWKIAGF